VVVSSVWTFFASPEQREGIPWATGILGCIAFFECGRRALRIFDKGINFSCPKCTFFIPHNLSWVCGYCGNPNAPQTGETAQYHLFRGCRVCRAIPLGFVCTDCKDIIQLTDHSVDPKRSARVYVPPAPEPYEIMDLRRQQEVERVRRQYQEEVAKEERRTRAREMSSNLETLAEKIKLTKGFETQARAMVQELKDTGFLKPHEEKIILEMIEDKVLEEFPVDRRGGRVRHNT
jgi:hypothetical protein